MHKKRIVVSLLLSVNFLIMAEEQEVAVVCQENSPQVVVIPAQVNGTKGYFSPVKNWFDRAKQWLYLKIKWSGVKSEEIKPIIEGEKINQFIVEMNRELEEQYTVIARKCKELESLLLAAEWNKEQEELALNLAADRDLSLFLQKATQDHKNYQSSLLLVLKYQILKRLETRRAELMLSDVQQLFEVDVDGAVKELVRRSREAVAQKEAFKQQADEMMAVVEHYLDGMRKYESDKKNISEEQCYLLGKFAVLYAELKKAKQEAENASQIPPAAAAEK